MDKQLRNAIKTLTASDSEARRRAMEPFVRATFSVFIKHLYRYLGNEVECEDVLEDVYTDIWAEPEHLANIETDSQLLRTVYMYYMRKRLREVYRRLNRNLSLSQTDMMNLVAPEPGTFSLLTEQELTHILRRMMGKLKSRERKAIELWMQGVSNRAIANELKTTVGAVKMLEFRTILKLRDMMKDYCNQD
jgi:RNA polymerase sigma factor (sigma-70 family)